MPASNSPLFDLGGLASNSESFRRSRRSGLGLFASRLAISCAGHSAPPWPAASLLREACWRHGAPDPLDGQFGRAPPLIHPNLRRFEPPMLVLTMDHGVARCQSSTKVRLTQRRALCITIILGKNGLTNTALRAGGRLTCGSTWPTAGLHRTRLRTYQTSPSSSATRFKNLYETTQETGLAIGCKRHSCGSPAIPRHCGPR